MSATPPDHLPLPARLSVDPRIPHPVAALGPIVHRILTPGPNITDAEGFLTLSDRLSGVVSIRVTSHSAWQWRQLGEPRQALRAVAGAGRRPAGGELARLWRLHQRTERPS